MNDEDIEVVYVDPRRDDLSIPYNFAPREITDLKRWMNWKYSETGTKIPIALGGFNGSSTDITCWSAFSIIRDSAEYYEGVAFVIDAPYTGIDLDNCFDEKQNLRPWAVKIVAKLDGIAYAEVSPSGRGIKFITRARKKITRCVKKFSNDNDKQQMEVYDHARFWTITGDVWAGNREIGDGQSAVDWICDEYLSGGAEEKVGTVKHEAVSYRAPDHSFSSLIDRANGYVSECKSVAKGGLRNSAFSISGHLHAMTDELGGRLTDQEVEYLLRDWNAKNFDKLRNEELAEAARNGRTNGTPRADKAPKEKVRLPEVLLPKVMKSTLTTTLPNSPVLPIVPSVSQLEELGKIFDDHQFPPVTPHVATKRSVTNVEAGIAGTIGVDWGTGKDWTAIVEIDTESGQVSGHYVQIPEKPPEVAHDPDNAEIEKKRALPCAYCKPPSFKGWQNGKCPYCGKTKPSASNEATASNDAAVEAGIPATLVSHVLTVKPVASHESPKSDTQTNSEPACNLTSKPKGRPKKPTPLPSDAFPIDVMELPGFLGDVCRYNLATARYPLPQLSLAAALTLLSTLTGGKVVLDRLRTNMMTIGLAKSGAGKEDGRRLNKEILRACGGEKMIGSEGVGSGPGIEVAIQDQWNTMLQVDEVHYLTVSMKDEKGQHSQVARILQMMYSSANGTYKSDALADKAKVRVIRYPHLVLYGSAVPGGFWESLSVKALTGGLMGRCLVFEEPDYVRLNTERSEEAIPTSIIDQAKWWMKFASENQPQGNLVEPSGEFPTEIFCSPDAGERLKSHELEISIRRIPEEEVQGAIWSRTAEKTCKLAMLFACSRASKDAKTPLIEIEDADNAIKLSNYITRYIIRKAKKSVAENEFEKLVNKFRAVFDKHPDKKFTERELSRKIVLKLKERGEVLAFLTGEGYIDGETIETGGRPSTHYWLKKEQDEEESHAGN